MSSEKSTAFAKTSYGVGSRLSDPPSPELRQFFQETYLDSVDAAAFEFSIEINIAHSIMLHERGIVPTDVTRQILGVLDTMHRGGLAAFTFDSALGDSLPNIENYVIAALGDRSGGMLHTGRSRGDYYATLSRLKYRRYLTGVMEKLIVFRRALADLATLHPESVMPGYTHMQHAQPISLSYYLCAYLNETERDFARLVDAYKRMNVSPLGLGIISGATYPLDRERTAKLLGFNGLLRNGRDLTDRDYGVESASAAATIMLHLHKLATDFYDWATAEFSTLRVAHQDAWASSMMPQKANPVLLEDIRAKASFVLGDVTTVLITLKGSPANNIEQTIADTPALSALRRTTGALAEFATFLPRIEFDLDRMRFLATQHWSQATDLADLLVTGTELSFREAHRVVGALVASSIAAGKLPDAVTHDDLETAAKSVLANPISLKHINLHDALDVTAGMERRKTYGGPAAALVRAEVAEYKKQLENDAAIHAHITGALASSRDMLLGEARRIAAG